MIALILCSLPCSLPPASPQRHAVAREVPAREPARTELPAGAEIRVHEAARLTGHARLEALEAELGRAPASAGASAALEALERIAARRTEVESIAKGLLEAVRDRMEPPLEAPGRLELLGGGRLALVGLPEQHAWLQSFLAEAATFQGLIDIQTKVYEVPRGVLPASFAERSGRALDSGEAAQLVALLAQEEIEPANAPRALVFPFREARLSVVEEIPYVQDFEIKVITGREGEIADPLIAVAEHGTHLALRAVPAAAGALVVYVDLDIAHVARPIASAEIELKAGVRVTVQLPEITHVGIEGRFELAPGQLVLLLAPADHEQKADVLVLLQARCVPEQAGGERR